MKSRENDTAQRTAKRGTGKQRGTRGTVHREGIQCTRADGGKCTGKRDVVRGDPGGGDMTARQCARGDQGTGGRWMKRGDGAKDGETMHMGEWEPCYMTHTECRHGTQNLDGFGVPSAVAKEVLETTTGNDGSQRCLNNVIDDLHLTELPLCNTWIAVKRLSQRDRHIISIFAEAPTALGSVIVYSVIVYNGVRQKLICRINPRRDEHGSPRMSPPERIPVKGAPLSSDGYPESAEYADTLTASVDSATHALPALPVRDRVNNK